MKEVIIILAGIALIGAAAVVALKDLVSPLFTKQTGKVEVQSRGSRRQSLSDFYCPISRELMTNPTKIRQCGHTFQEEFIVKWLNTKNTCPLCRNPASLKDLKQNDKIKNLVRRAIEEGIVN